jgi:hypothetical protein
MPGVRPGKGRVKLLNLGFQMLVEQQQHFKRAVDVAVASCNDLVDRSHLISPELHIRSPVRITPAKYRRAIRAKISVRARWSKAGGNLNPKDAAGSADGTSVPPVSQT